MVTLHGHVHVVPDEWKQIQNLASNSDIIICATSVHVNKTIDSKMYQEQGLTTLYNQSISLFPFPGQFLYETKEGYQISILLHISQIKNKADKKDVECMAVQKEQSKN